MKRWIGRYATIGLAASDLAAKAIWGDDWRNDRRVHILRCGIEVGQFTREVSRAEVRRSIGIPVEARVIGHVGRFVDAKNHLLLLDIASEVARIRPDVFFLFVGDGPLRQRIEERIGSLGLTSRVVLTGVRSDVVEIMLGGMDLFCMPSAYEGLPVAAIEAQAAGLPCLISNNVTREIAIIPRAVEFVSLSAGPRVWAERALSLLDGPRVDLESSRAVLAGSPFAIEQSVATLSRLYSGAA